MRKKQLFSQNSYKLGKELRKYPNEESKLSHDFGLHFKQSFRNRERNLDDDSYFSMIGGKAF